MMKRLIAHLALTLLFLPAAAAQPLPGQRDGRTLVTGAPADAPALQPTRVGVSACGNGAAAFAALSLASLATLRITRRR